MTERSAEQADDGALRAEQAPVQTRPDTARSAIQRLQPGQCRAIARAAAAPRQRRWLESKASGQTERESSRVQPPAAGPSWLGAAGSRGGGATARRGRAQASSDGPAAVASRRRCPMTPVAPPAAAATTRRTREQRPACPRTAPGPAAAEPDRPVVGDEDVVPAVDRLRHRDRGLGVHGLVGARRRRRLGLDQPDRHRHRLRRQPHLDVRHHGLPRHVAGARASPCWSR